ncbi:MAG: hypothetical protein ABFD82_01665 [Syntrophaceae bacterium]
MEELDRSNPKFESIDVDDVMAEPQASCKITSATSFGPYCSPVGIEPPVR